MSGSGEETKETIRPEFNPGIMIDFQGAKISSDTGFLLLKEMDERFAYNLLHILRQFYLVGEEVKRSMEWLIKPLIKVGAKIAYHGRRWYAHLASALPLARYYQAVFG